LGNWNQLKDRPRYATIVEHELYDMGHLVMAACIHHRATGKESFLNLAKKAADHLYATFIDPARDELLWKRGVFLPENITLTEEFRKDLLGNVVVLKGKALTPQGRDTFIAQNSKAPIPKAEPFEEGELYREFAPRKLAAATDGTVPIKLIPYYAWANRDPSYMEVWTPAGSLGRLHPL